MGNKKFFRQFFVTFIITTLALVILSRLMSGFDLNNDLPAAISMSAILSLINVVLWPLIIRLALPFTVLTFGLGVLILNGMAVSLAASLGSTEVYIESFWDSIIVALGVTVLNTLVMSIFSVEDDDFYYLNIVKKNLNKKSQSTHDPNQTGRFFLEIDGLAHDVLLRALRDGNAPTMSRWLREGSHKLIGWETDWSSQTGAMQAGILHGNNKNMPAFRWWEKAENRAMVSNHPKDAMEIESRHSNGRGLLANNGASRANLLSGDAPYSMLTMSTVLKKNRGGRIGRDYYTFFVNPYNLLRTIVLTIQEVVIELWQANQQKRLDVYPRVHRGFSYSLLRAWTTVIQRDLQVQAIIGDMLAGRPIAYTTFLGYDEVAHHSGIERLDALAVLRRIDRQFKRIESVIKIAPIKYELIILSDHGQTQGATFLQRYGLSLEQLVTNLTNAQVAVVDHGDESASSLKTSITEVGSGKGGFAKIVRGLHREHKPSDQTSAENSNIVVMASGCLGLIYFKDIKSRATAQQIENKYPNLIQSLVAHPGVGFLLVKDKDNGSVVLGRDGKNFLDQNRIEGKDPLEHYGENASQHVLRTSSFTNCADIMINSTYWPMTGEVAAFEELVGSHGGLGGTQNHPFVLFPAAWTEPTKDIVGAETLHHQLLKWLK